MDCSNPTPRVGYPQLKSFINQRVLFVGKVESLSPGCAHMLAPDGSKVVVQTNSTYNSMFVEVEGVVVDPSTIREEAHVDMNETFDMNNYNELLKHIHGNNSSLFYGR